MPADGNFPQGADRAAIAIQDVLLDNPMVGEARSGSRRFWTGREELILRNTYPSLGLAGCVDKLPGRSAKSIYQHARIIGLVAPGAGRKDGLPRQRWTSSETTDALIRQVYTRAPQKSDVKKLAQTIGRPSWWVSRRATQLGLVVPRFRSPPWTEAEEEILAEHAYKHPDTIKKLLRAKGFVRTGSAVAVKLKRLGSDKTDPHHFTAHQMAKVMGVDSKSVSRWIVKGWLKAKRRGTNRLEVQGGDEWWIHEKDVRAFIIDSVAVVDIRKCDKFWLVALLAGRGEK